MDDSGIDEFLSGTDPQPSGRRVPVDLTSRGFGIALVALTAGFAIVLAAAGLPPSRSAIRSPAGRIAPWQPPAPLGGPSPAGAPPARVSPGRATSRDRLAGVAPRSGSTSDSPVAGAGVRGAVAQPPSAGGAQVPASPAPGQPGAAPRPAGHPAVPPPGVAGQQAGAGNGHGGPPRHAPGWGHSSGRTPGHGTGWGRRPGRQPAPSRPNLPVTAVPVAGIPAPSIPLPSLPVPGILAPGNAAAPGSGVPHHPWAPAAPHHDPVPPGLPAVTTPRRPAATPPRVTRPDRHRPAHWPGSQGPRSPQRGRPHGWGLPLSLLGFGSLALALTLAG
jgi:hypothetical protein